VGGIASVNVTLKNIGNAADDHFMVKVSVSTSPPNQNVIAFLNIGNIEQYNHLTMAAGQERVVMVDLIIPDDMPLNTRIVVSFEVQAGEDFESKPFELQHDILILVDTQRIMVAEISLQSDQTFTTGMPAPFWINITSSSTQVEQYLITVEQPEQWQTVCQGVLVNQSGQELEHSAGHMTSKYTDMMCELHRIGGDANGEVKITVESTDGVLSWSDSLTFQFSIAEDDGFQMNTEAIASSVAGVLFIALLLTLLLRKRRETKKEYLHFNQEEIVENEALVQPTTNGPPTSTVGPPVTNFNLHEKFPESTESDSSGPQLPVDGLPPGWTSEQWQYYGQQYLDTKQ
jgi:hypothetical protein